MSFLSVLLAAGSLVPFTMCAPMHRPAPVQLAKRSSDSYTFYQGTGNTPPWPAQSAWVGTLAEMFTYNKNILENSCSQFNVPNNSEQEISDLQTAIQTVAGQTGVDARFIFAITLQESNGCVRAPTTNGGVVNPGLMQDHDGTASCNIGGVVSNPCPADTITAMISQGVAGTPEGDGLVQCLSKSGASDGSQYYKAARIYNSGSIAAGGDLGAGVATHCYASDVANRLTGWVTAPKTCTLDGAVSGSSSGPPVSEGGSGSGSGSGSSPSSAPVPATSTAAAPKPTQTATTTTTAHGSTQTNTAPGTGGGQFAQTGSSGSATPGASLAPGVTTSCSKYYTIQNGDTCNSVASQFGTTFAELQQLNTGLDATCSNLWLGYSYCVAS